MPLTDQDIRALTYLAGRCRPTGAPQWDEAGIFAAIAKVRNMHLADVALAVIRAADDAGAKTPGVIANTSAPNWQERAINRPVPREPWDPAKFCHVCGKSSHAGPSDHEFETAVEHQRRLTHEPPKPPLRDLATRVAPEPRESA
jgi:hypothetical protein